MADASRRPARFVPGADFLIKLEGMSQAQRRRASRRHFDPHQRAVWAARFPDEVPLLNGELEWITRTSADLD